MAVFKGQTVAIGFGGHTYSGYIMEEAVLSATGETEVIKNEDNATGTVIDWDPGRRLKISALIKTALPTTDPLPKGSTVAINSINWRIEDSEVTLVRSASKLTMTMIKETSMTY